MIFLLDNRFAIIEFLYGTGQGRFTLEISNHSLSNYKAICKFYEKPVLSCILSDCELVNISSDAITFPPGSNVTIILPPIKSKNITLIDSNVIIDGDLVIQDSDLHIDNSTFFINGSLILSNTIIYWGPSQNSAIIAAGCIDLNQTQIVVQVPPSSDQLVLFMSDCVVGGENLSIIMVGNDSECWDDEYDYTAHVGIIQFSWKCDEDNWGGKIVIIAGSILGGAGLIALIGVIYLVALRNAEIREMRRKFAIEPTFVF